MTSSTDMNHELYLTIIGILVTIIGVFAWPYIRQDEKKKDIVIPSDALPPGSTFTLKVGKEE